MENFERLEWLSADPLKKLNGLKLRKLSQGRYIYDLSMINPDLDPPRIALDKLTEAVLKPGQHRYAVSRGIRKLREAFASKYEKSFGVRVDAEKEICICLGTKDGLSILLSCLCLSCRRILVGSPCYAMYRSAAALMDLQVDFFPIDSDETRMLESIREKVERFQPAVLLLNFPNNPTGITVTKDFYRRLGALLEGKNCAVINDFVYGEMGFSGPHEASLIAEPSMRGHAFETYSLSKAYSIPGWRIGAIVGSEALMPWISKLKSHLDYGAFLPLQVAAASLLTSQNDLVAPAVAAYRQRAQVLVQGLRGAGWDPSMPGGGASVWAKIPERHAGKGSIRFSEELLEKEDIAVLPGVLFGAEFDSYVRFALVRPEEVIRDVLSRLEGFY